MTSKLYTPLQMGPNLLANRMFMAPLTRTRADSNETHMPNDLMAEYYSQRATAGLIIAECTMITDDCSAFYADPGIYNDAQVEGWKKTTEAVHKVGGKIFLQIWHAGRAAPAEYNKGKQPIAPSAIAIPHRYGSAVTKELTPNDVPREMTDDEAKGIVQAYAAAAKRAMAAGFDGVELHGANGYLINQFLTPNANKRGPESRYSGASIETRARFMLDVVEACAEAIGADRVGIRLSPLVTYNAAYWENPEAEIPYVASELSKRGIVYIHVERRNMLTNERDATADVTGLFRANFNGVVISNIDFEREEAEQYVEEGRADAVAFGMGFLCNPDLVRRFKEKRAERNPPPEQALLYAQGPKGYTDYPFLE